MSDRALFVVLGVALIVLSAGDVARRSTRGVRNNNPGNIRRTGIGWQGELPEAQKTDPDFEQFTAPEWGIRAIARDLMTGAARGTVTVRGIISEWSPPNENDTPALIAAAARSLNVDPDAPLNVGRELPRLVGAIIRQENGFDPYPPSLIERGISLA